MGRGQAHLIGPIKRCRCSNVSRGNVVLSCGAHICFWFTNLTATIDRISRGVLRARASWCPLLAWPASAGPIQSTPPIHFVLEFSSPAAHWLWWRRGKIDAVLRAIGFAEFWVLPDLSFTPQVAHAGRYGYLRGIRIRPAVIFVPRLWDFPVIFPSSGILRPLLCFVSWILLDISVWNLAPCSRWISRDADFLSNSWVLCRLWRCTFGSK